MTLRFHGGNLTDLAERCGLPPSQLIDFSANMNPLGPPSWLRREIDKQVSLLQHYPDPNHRELQKAATTRYGISAEETVWGNGASEIIFATARALPATTVHILIPCYSDYQVAFQQAGHQVQTILRMEEDQFKLPETLIRTTAQPGQIVLLGNPNNPDGNLTHPDRLRALAKSMPRTTFIIDEAFIDFCEDRDSLLPNPEKNMIVWRSLTKCFAIPGLRLGFAVARNKIAADIRAQIPTWSVNHLAQAVGARALLDYEYQEQSRRFLPELRTNFFAALQKLPDIKVYPSRGNYLLLRLADPSQAQALAHNLLKQGIAVRRFDNHPGLDPSFLRVAVREETDNQDFIRQCRTLLGIETGEPRPRKKPALFFGGTGSNVGKTLLNAAFCRILVQDGYRVAPFKAQNMSLNAYVTKDGGEMSRAQALQAAAAKIDPEVRMNPVLMKPVSGAGSHIILNGKPAGLMTYQTYKSRRKDIREAVISQYDSLSRDFDAVVLEGAGSLAEINLKQHDLVNLNMARYAQAPVVLVGDIDRGGVYASFIGTLAVLDDWERNQIAGFMVNRFRGDARLLNDAHQYMETNTGKPVLGKVPWLPNLRLPEEDSVNFKEGALNDGSTLAGRLDVVIIDLPHVANFSDFDPLRAEPALRLRTVTDVGSLGNPDVVILPGSRNTKSDLGFLHQTGFSEALPHLVREQGVELVGICGGLQMLGRNIRDPLAVEATGEDARGLGLLAMDTIFSSEKVLRRTRALHPRSGHWIHGYEIHHGRCVWGSHPVCFQTEAGEVLGTRHETMPVWGAYLHGLFDHDDFRHWWMEQVAGRRGKPLTFAKNRFQIEPELDRLADHVRAHVNLEHLYRLMGL